MISFFSDESTSTVKDTGGRKSKLSWSKVKKRLTESLSHVGGSSSSSRHTAGGSSCPAEEAAAEDAPAAETGEEKVNS